MVRICIFLVCILSVLFSGVSGQGLPPGWEYNPTPNTHIISVPLSSNPNINGFPLKPGDWIGVFYVNSSGGHSCGGAVEWNGTQNTGIIAFGDDVFTPQKDGFSNNEPIIYKVFSWSVQTTYSASVTCNPALPNTCLNFVANGLSGITSFNASGLYLILNATATSICQGASVQLSAQASGGSGNYIYQWTSNPPGFTSNLQNPVVNPQVTTSYQCQVTSQNTSVATSITIEVIPPPSVNAGNNSTICSGQSFQLNGSTTNTFSNWWTSSGDGTFSNNTILNPVYYPGTNDIQNGSVQLCLHGASIPECPAATSCLTLSILPLPAVSLVTYPSFCAGDPSFILYGGSPPGGIYFVNGVQTNIFNPSIAGVYTIVYQYTNPNGCTNSATSQILVNPLPAVTCPANSIICCTSSPIVLSGGSPPGGTYSGPGVINNVFYPDCNNTGNFMITYTYQNQATGCTNSCQFTITVKPLPQVTCPNDLQVCINTPSFPLTGGFPPSGNYFGPGVMNNIFYPSLAGAGNHLITYTFTDGSGCTNNCTFFIQVNPLPSVNAGPPQMNIQLPNTIVTLNDASASNYTSILWTTSGTGTFNNPAVVNPQYHLSQGDIQNGNVLLTMSATNLCGTVSDQILIVISDCLAATVNAGSNQTICQGESFFINDASAVNYSFLFWSNSGGDGFFSNPNIINPVYYPGQGDIQNGSVQLVLTAFPLEPCDTVSDSRTLFITRFPVVNVGPDITICQNQVVNLNASASHYSYLLWSTDGDGTFTNPGNPQTNYIPGFNDVNLGQVNLKLTAFPLSPCQNSSFDQLLVNITKLPFVDVGPDMTISEGQQAQLNAIASHYAQLLWSTSGDGNFSSVSILNPLYTPGPLDIQNGSVVLTLKAFPLSPCLNTSTDELVLTIENPAFTNNFSSDNEKWLIYPNPSTEQICVEAKVPSIFIRKIAIGLLSGEQIFKKEFQELEFTRFCIDISGFKSGIYLMGISDTYNSVSYHKVIIHSNR